MSTIDVANLTDGTDTVATGYVINGSAKSWVNFNGTGTIAIRNSMNVSSLTDESTGRYSVNLTSSMSSANLYAITATKQDISVNTDSTCFDAINSRTASLYSLVSVETGVKTDSQNVNAIQMGELA